MNVIVRSFTREDIPAMIQIWNKVVEEGNAFPQDECLTPEAGYAFFYQQSYCGVAQDLESGILYGLYILHPNNVGRCGHICNASYGVYPESRGKHIGEKLVSDSLIQARRHQFKILQFNAVVANNASARRLYEKLGFKQLGTIPGGFRMNDGHYEDICPYYIVL
ncbi:MAG: GNAT family N-acetyltransferase [Dehalococcoidales bacterium]|nr:GNAT family N-acetyltransferase [Dehalococcoidales bacterium]